LTAKLIYDSLQRSLPGSWMWQSECGSSFTHAAGSDKTK